MSAFGEIRFVQCVLLQLLLLIMKRECGVLPNYIYNYSSIDARLTDPPIDASRPAYPCLSALKIDLRDQRQLLIGACSHFSLKLSSEIGTLPSSQLDQSIRAKFGGIMKPCLNRSRPDCYIDGVGGQAQIVTAEYLVQRKNNPNILYFVDGQSCIRQAELDTGNVTTIVGVGNCGNGTLDMLPTEQDFAGGLVRGMEYYEKRDLFFVAIINHGLWEYFKSGNFWKRKKLIDRDSISSTVSDLVRQITIQDGILWQRVWKGINAYNLTNLTSDGQGELHPGTSYDYRFLSSPGSGTIDPTAKYNNTDPNLALGESDAQLSFSPNKSILMIADISQDRLFFMDPLTGNLTVFCQKVWEHFQDANDPENCTFNTLSASMWLDNGTVLIFDANRDGDKPAFRTFELEPSSTTSPTTTLGSKTISNEDDINWTAFWICMGILVLVIIIVLFVLAHYGWLCFKDSPFEGICTKKKCCSFANKAPSAVDPSSQEPNRASQSPKDVEIPKSTGQNKNANPTSEPRDMRQPTDDTTCRINFSDEPALPTQCTENVESTEKSESGKEGNSNKDTGSAVQPQNRADNEKYGATDQNKPLL